MPLIKNSTFRAHPFFRGKHVETIFPALFRKVMVQYQRERIATGDADFIDLDWIKTHQDKLVILLHGLEGSAHSGYIMGFADFFSRKGFDVCAVNFRGCSGEDNLKLQSYHSGATADVHRVIQHVLNKQQYKQIAMAGFSLGGNILLKYLGEQGSSIDPAVHCAVAFSVPCDLAGSSAELAKAGNRIYMSRFLKTLKKKIILKAQKFPAQVNLEGIRSIRNFYGFDNRYTGPIHGFKDAADYWSKCSSKQFLASIRIPVLLVNALNDPFLSAGCFPYTEAAASGSVYLETPASGGHVGFASGMPNGAYWSEHRAFGFISGYLDPPIEKKN